MKITKIFTAESSHIVRNCTSKACSYSLHGHSYKIELELEAKHLDNAGMVVDFGLLKGSIKQFIESMDHCHVFTMNDNGQYVFMCKKFSDRWIQLPFNPSAEMLSMFFFRYCQEIIKATLWANGEDEGSLKVSSVTVHETATGRAQCFQEDIDELWNEEWFDYIQFSKGAREGWCKELKQFVKDLTDDSVEDKCYFINKEVKQQVKF